MSHYRKIACCDVYSLAPFTRYNRLSNRFDNRFDNRLYRVNGVFEYFQVTYLYLLTMCDISVGGT